MIFLMFARSLAIFCLDRVSRPDGIREKQFEFNEIASAKPKDIEAIRKCSGREASRPRRLKNGKPTKPKKGAQARPKSGCQRAGRLNVALRVSRPLSCTARARWGSIWKAGGCLFQIARRDQRNGKRSLASEATPWKTIGRFVFRVVNLARLFRIDPTSLRGRTEIRAAFHYIEKTLAPKAGPHQRRWMK
jgi:hypothetical protein